MLASFLSTDYSLQLDSVVSERALTEEGAMKPTAASALLIAISMSLAGCGDSGGDGKATPKTGAKETGASAVASQSPKAQDPPAVAETPVKKQEPAPAPKDASPVEKEAPPVPQEKPPVIEAKEFMIPLPDEVVKIDVDKLIPLPAAPAAEKPDVPARLEEIKNAAGTERNALQQSKIAAGNVL